MAQGILAVILSRSMGKRCWNFWPVWFLWHWFNIIRCYISQIGRQTDFMLYARFWRCSFWFHALLFSITESVSINPPVR